MNDQTPSVTYTSLTKERNQVIFRLYIDLMRQERAENELRAKYISKFYYAQLISSRMTPEMGTLDPNYIMRIINNILKGGGK